MENRTGLSLEQSYLIDELHRRLNKPLFVLKMASPASHRHSSPAQIKSAETRSQNARLEIYNIIMD